MINDVQWLIAKLEHRHPTFKFKYENDTIIIDRLSWIKINNLIRATTEYMSHKKYPTILEKEMDILWAVLRAVETIAGLPEVKYEL